MTEKINSMDGFYTAFYESILDGVQIENAKDKMYICSICNEGIRGLTALFIHFENHRGNF